MFSSCKHSIYINIIIIIIVIVINIFIVYAVFKIPVGASCVIMN